MADGTKSPEDVMRKQMDESVPECAPNLSQLYIDRMKRINYDHQWKVYM